MRAMILAAGLGKRMRPLTDETPKPLLRVGGRPLIEYHIERLAAAGFAELVINTAWLGEQIEHHLGAGERFGVRIRYSREGDPLETAGGIIEALPLLGEAPFVVVNGDIWTDFDFAGLRRTPASEAHLVLVDNPEHNAGGDFRLDDQGRVSLETGRPLTFSGIGLYRPEFFAGLAPGERPLSELLAAAIKRGKVTGEHHPGVWLDIGTPERLRQLDRQLEGSS
jgi:MurNAc alpha-1-phosphate uridylyltransferase